MLFILYYLVMFLVCILFFFFFFKQKTAYEMRISDWSSDVCSSDLEALTGEAARQWLNGRDEALKAAAAALRTSPDEVPARVAALAEQLKKAERELADAKKALALGGAGGGGGGAAAGPAVEQVGDVAFLAQVVDGLDPKELRGTVDGLKKQVRSEEHTSELQSLMRISYAVFCLKKKK